MAVVAVLVSVAAYILIAHRAGSEDGDGPGRPWDHSWSGVASAEEVFYSHETGVDWDAIFLLLAMMIIVGCCAEPGCSSTWPSGGQACQGFAVSGDGAAGAHHRGRLRPAGQRHHSAADRPVTLLVCDRLAVPLIPFLVAEVLASNIGGASTLIRDPPNIIIASRSGLTFNDLLLHMTSIAALAIATMIAMLSLLFRGAFKGDPDRVADVMR